MVIKIANLKWSYRWQNWETKCFVYEIFPNLKKREREEYNAFLRLHNCLVTDAYFLSITVC